MRIPLAITAAAAALTLSACGAATTGTDLVADQEASSAAAPAGNAKPKASAKPKAPAKPKMTKTQANAVRSAQSYLDMSGFSKQGLIHQLSSSAGEGYTKADATFAVNYLKPNWKKEAVEAAESYQQTMPMSRAGLIHQLSSSAGEGFTKAEATYAADKVLK
ncbi:Ltp family lipoprotein [Pedococcus sp. 2YAF34]|uniref:Ltp family lipoprotein n=1 Tax=Pedococcus sp. 2YAF34 TaxID=3233032 RepID=UPI003F9AD834